MEFLEDLLDFGDRKRKKRSGIFGRGDQHDDHDEHHDDDDHHGHYPDNHSQVYPSNPVMPSTGLFCTRCSTKLVPGAKFCHQCGTVLELKTNCGSCGSSLPANALFCPQCGYKSG
jgi:ribosomal protein L40E